ncbi:MAG TPA: HAD-IB family phosphatase [Gemmatimonadaceae bacterium]|nr:HAD-IB family phosphatase [Gemmatimonadaceae bacterium]
MTRFNSVVLDVDSTLSGIEGIDWLAKLRGKEVAEWSTALTDKAMRGEIPIEAVYGERMRTVRPVKAEIEQLGREYVDRIAPRARETLSAIKGANVHVVMVSGGLREAILPLAAALEVAEQDLHAVSVTFDEKGGYAGFDEGSPLTRQTGKKTVVGAMGLKGPILAVGDGMTDCEMKAVVDSFAAYTGFTRRNPVVEQADFVIENFDQLRELVLQ